MSSSGQSIGCCMRLKNGLEVRSQVASRFDFAPELAVEDSILNWWASPVAVSTSGLVGGADGLQVGSSSGSKVVERCHSVAEHPHEKPCPAHLNIGLPGQPLALEYLGREATFAEAWWTVLR